MFGPTKEAINQAEEILINKPDKVLKRGRESLRTNLFFQKEVNLSNRSNLNSKPSQFSAYAEFVMIYSLDGSRGQRKLQDYGIILYMEKRAEQKRGLSSKDQILQWLETDEAKRVYQTFSALYKCQHSRGNMPYRLHDLFPFDSEVTKLSLRKQLAWLKERLPIEDMRHAVYIPDKNTLLLSKQNEIWETAAVTSLEEQVLDAVECQERVFPGMVAKIKSTGWKIFVPAWTVILFQEDPSRALPIRLDQYIKGIKSKGYMVLVPEVERTGFYNEKGGFTLATNR